MKYIWFRVHAVKIKKIRQDNGGARGDGDARGVMVIIAGNGHGDTSSNPRRDWLHFT